MKRVLFWTIVLVFAVKLTGGSAYANDRETLALARICASEAGIQTETPDCAGILSVLRNRAARMHVTLYQAMRAYCPRSFSTVRADRRQWIAHLSLDGQRPRGWPSQMRWDRDKWLDLVSAASVLLVGESHYPTAMHWGMQTGSDLKRAQRAGWIRIQIEGARNAFWAVR